MRERVFACIRQAARWLFWPGVALVIWGELTPNPPDVAQDVWDKAEHFTAYFGLAAMAMLVLAVRGAPLRTRLLALAGIWLLGVTLEIVQAFVGRDAELGDVAANSLGVIGGMLAALLFLRLFGQRARRADGTLVDRTLVDRGPGG